MIHKVNIASSHRSYIADHPDGVDMKTYLKITLGFIKFIMDKVFKGIDVNLSTGDSLGTIGVRGTKVTPFIDDNGDIKGVAPAWGRTKKLWETDPIAKENKTILYCFNEHSNGYRYKLVWDRTGMKLMNSQMYILSFNRVNKRILHKLILSGEGEYLVNPIKEKNYGKNKTNVTNEVCLTNS